MHVPPSLTWSRWMIAIALASVCRDESSGDGEDDGPSDESTSDAADDDDDDDDDDDGDSSTGVADTTAAGSDGSSSDETTVGIIEVDCTDACADTTSDLGIRTCYSCRCLAAFDGWLPSPDEVQCGDTPEIVTYLADVSGAEAELVPVEGNPDECANPSLLTGECREGTRFGQLTHGDVMFKWICRDPYDNGSGKTYTDMGLIGHNTRTGATCFWDDVDNVTHDDDMPPLDLMTATDEERDRFLEVFYHTEGETCVGCHDHDPFIQTPYLQSAAWEGELHRMGPYAVVGLGGQLHPTENKHLVSPPVVACTMCHRLGSQASCTDFSRDAMGMDKASWSYEQAIIDAAQPDSPFWRLAYWMPGLDLDVPDYESWETLFDIARDHLMDCCASPGVDQGACVWADVPDQPRD